MDKLKNASKGFIGFITQKNIVNLSIAYIIGRYVNDLSNGIIEVFITPILNAISGTKVENMEKYSFKFKGTDVPIGKLLYLIIKFFLVLVVIYFLYESLPRLVADSAKTIRKEYMGFME